MKQTACHLPFYDHFGLVVSAMSKPDNSMNSRTDLNVACVQGGYLLSSHLKKCHQKTLPCCWSFFVCFVLLLLVFTGGWGHIWWEG